MTFSTRLEKLRPEGAYHMMAKAKQLESEGRKILHLEIGQPEVDTFDHIAMAGIDAIQSGQTRYNPPSGLDTLRQAISDDASHRRGMRIRPSQVVVGPGAKPGLFFPTMALVEKGDQVLYPDPGFPTYEAMVHAAGGIPVPVPLSEDNGFSFDFKCFNRLMNDQVKMIVINSPGNPTGGVIPQSDLEIIADAAKKYNAWVLSDEIYSRLAYTDAGAPSIAAIPGMQDRTIIVDGFSKTYAMTGWRLGYMIVPESLALKLELLLTHAIGCTATFTQVAGIEALTASQEIAEQVKHIYQARRDLMVDGLNGIKGISCQVPQGAFYAFPNIKKTGIPSATMAGQLLEEVGVATLSGTDFGSNGQGYLRLCYAVSPDTIKTALAQIKNFLG